MNNKRDDLTNKGERQPYRVRRPGFNTDKEVGIGDVAKLAASAKGIRPAGVVSARVLFSTIGLFSRGRL